jgi:hypothetical protein
MEVLSHYLMEQPRRSFSEKFTFELETLLQFTDQPTAVVEVFKRFPHLNEYMSSVIQNPFLVPYLSEILSTFNKGNLSEAIVYTLYGWETAWEYRKDDELDVQNYIYGLRCEVQKQIQTVLYEALREPYSCLYLPVHQSRLYHYFNLVAE